MAPMRIGALVKQTEKTDGKNSNKHRTEQNSGSLHYPDPKAHAIFVAAMDAIAKTKV